MPLSVATRVDRLAARDDLAGYSCDPDLDYWYRDGELLVHRDDLEAAREVLDELGAEPVGLPDELRYLARLEPPVQRFRLPAGVHVPAAVARLRRIPGRLVRVSPTHVFGAFPHHFFPGSNPIATDEQVQLADPVDDSPLRVAVLDTGLVVERDAAHNPHRDAHERLALDAARDDERLDDQPRDGMLDDADAHGGFVVDLVRQHAPKVRVRGAKVLLGGLADELQIADGLARVVAEDQPQIVNLSLGGYTDGDEEPLVLSAVLRRLDPAPVLVAAAGNNARTRRTWPAAFNEVIGVGAVHEPARLGRRPRPPRPADFTNRGCWVDACAVGVDVLGSYVEFEERAPRPATAPLTDPTPDPQAFSGWARWSGTSFAAPLVAARIADLALRLHEDHGLSPQAAAHRAAVTVVGGAPVRVPGLGAYVD